MESMGSPSEVCGEATAAVSGIYRNRRPHTGTLNRRELCDLLPGQRAHAEELALGPPGTRGHDLHADHRFQTLR